MGGAGSVLLPAFTGYPHTLPFAPLQVWVVLAPYCHLSLDKYATLLWHHVLWHDKLGITRYLLYVTVWLVGLLT